MREAPAAFGRLRVETKPSFEQMMEIHSQPPSGGCVLKLFVRLTVVPRFFQPPSGGCVLKQTQIDNQLKQLNQPPSGGCVLKLC